MSRGRWVGSPTPVLAALTAMLAASAAYSGLSTPLLASLPALAALALLPALGLDGWLLTYFSMALAVFYASTSPAALALVPLYSVLLTRFVSGLSLRASPGGVVGPSSASVLRPLPLYLLGALANYRVVFSVAAVAASVLALTLVRYVALHSARVVGVSYDREVSVGGALRVVVAVDPGRGAYVLASLGGVTRLVAAPAPARVVLRWVPPAVGRHSLTLAVSVLDGWLAASRTLAEVPVTVTVKPAYAAVAERLRRELPPAPTPFGEPVKARAFIIGAGRGAGSGEGEVIKYLMTLPQPLRSLARALLTPPTALGRGAGVARGGARRGVFGEYYGAREYSPGDDPRAIHWKKSASLGRLIVKEYVAGESAAAGSLGVGRYAPIIIADLTPSSNRELDKLATALLTTLHTAARASSEARTLLITVFGDAAITLEGSVRDVAARVAEAFTKIIPTTIHEYETITTPPTPEAAENIIRAGRDHALLRAIAHTTQNYARKITETIIAHGHPPPRTAIIIHGKPTTLRNTALTNTLTKTGYKATNSLITQAKRSK